jgi:hypothetical protein
VPKENVLLLDSIPGERTGHVDLLARVVDYEKNVVAVPEIPAYAMEHFSGPEDAIRRELAGRYNEYLNGIAGQLQSRGLTVRRIPMFAPERLRGDSGTLIDSNHPTSPSRSPFGVDVRFGSTANFSEGGDGLINVPIHIAELTRLSPENQKRFHQDMGNLFGDRYQPVGADTAFSHHGGAHCLTWTVNAETGRVGRIQRY